MSQIFGNVVRIFMDIISGISLCIINCLSIFNQKSSIMLSRSFMFLIDNFRIESFKWYHVVSYVEDGCNSSDCFRGNEADVIHLLQKELNFTYTIVSPFDWPDVGRKQSNGSYTGTLGSWNLERVNSLPYIKNWQ